MLTPCRRRAGAAAAPRRTVLAPVAGGDERGPVERMGALACARARSQDASGSLDAQRPPCSSRFLSLPLGRARRIHVRVARSSTDHRLMMTVRAPAIWNARRRPEHAFAGLDLARDRSRRRTAPPTRASQIERRDLLGRQDAVVFVRPGRGPPVGAGQGEAGEEQRVVGHGAEPGFGRSRLAAPMGRIPRRHGCPRPRTRTRHQGRIRAWPDAGCGLPVLAA